MNNDNQGDRPSRKSARQRVPNSFYTQVINQLKRAPSKSQRQPSSKNQNKKQRIYHQSSQNSQAEENNQQESNPVAQQNKNWYTCKLPKNGQVLKVRFIMNNNQEQIIDKKKEEPQKITKKIDQSFDLLALFQNAIAKVNVEQQGEKPNQIESNLKTGTTKIYRIVKRARKQDSQGYITQVHMKENKVVFVHSVTGQIEFQLRDTQEQQEFNQSQVQQLKDKILNTQVSPSRQSFKHKTDQ